MDPFSFWKNSFGGGKKIQPQEQVQRFIALINNGDFMQKFSEISIGEAKLEEAYKTMLCIKTLPQITEDYPAEFCNGVRQSIKSLMLRMTKISLQEITKDAGQYDVTPPSPMMIKLLDVYNNLGAVTGEKKQAISPGY